MEFRTVPAGRGLTVTALDEGRELGRGELREDVMHANLYLTEVEVSPDVRRQGVGRSIVAELRRARPEPWRLMARAMDSRPERGAFLEAVDFRTVAECPSPWVDAGSPAVLAWCDQQVPPLGLDVVPVAELDGEVLLDAWLRLTEATHDHLRVRPRAELRALLGDDSLSWVDRVGSRAGVVEGEVRALALLNPQAWEGRTFVVADATDGSATGRSALGPTLAAVLTSHTGRVEVEGFANSANADIRASVPAVGADRMRLLVSD